MRFTVAAGRFHVNHNAKGKERRVDFNTGGGTGGTASPGGSSGGTGGAPPTMTGGAGGEFDYRDPVQSFIRTVTSVVTRPAAFFSGIRRQGDFINPLIFALICAVISAVLTGIISFFFTVAGGDQGVGSALASLIGTIIVTPILSAVGLFIGAGIFHLLVMLLVRPSNAGFEATFRVSAYASVTQLVAWIPVIGFIVSLYGLYLGIVGIREVHSTTTGRAALVVLIPAAVVLLFVLLVFAAVAAFFLSQQ